MKAIKILKKIYKNNPDTRIQRNNVDVNFTIHDFNNINEAIKELEELENRSCGNCKYSYYDKEDAILMCTNEDNNQEYLYNSKMQITLDFYCNKWENKA